jgi:hypothetical protein
MEQNRLPCAAHYRYREGCHQCMIRNGELSPDEQDDFADAVEAMMLASVSDATGASGAD